MPRMARISGSSPLTRGKHGATIGRSDEPRLIPAHAGKTRPLRGLKPLKMGSSPLTRGKHMLPSWKGPEDRLIPAHAGKTSVASTLPGSKRAHPRSRGENRTPSRMRVYTSGSSPLTRGKLAAVNPTFATVRLIPAHAGKTGDAVTRQISRRAHPRSRGENEKERTVIKNREGSSPLTRGKPSRGLPHAPLVRLIPAHAGKTRHK